MGVTAARGFVASGVAAGIRRRDRKDLAIVRSVPHAVGAAMFTRNRVQAACLLVNREHLTLADPQAVVINSGVANAATGERGKLDALATATEGGRRLAPSVEGGVGAPPPPALGGGPRASPGRAGAARPAAPAAAGARAGGGSAVRRRRHR